jgi:creatinine amidohydrolase
MGIEVEWARMTAPDLREIAARKGALTILPAGSLEQHGPHLPVITDTASASAASIAAARLVVEGPDPVPVAVLPGLWLGLSEHHLPFGGTISVDYTAYRAMLESIVRSLRALGFARLLIVNGHGGNIDPLAVASRELAVAYDFPIVATTPWFLAPAKIAAIFESDTAPKHACEGETSVMMAIAKDIVKAHKLDEAMQQAPAPVQPPAGFSRFYSFSERAPVTGTWGTRGPPRPKRARASLPCRPRHWRKLSATRRYGRALIRSGVWAAGRRPRPARWSEDTVQSAPQFKRARRGASPSTIHRCERNASDGQGELRLSAVPASRCAHHGVR